jgi:hypothetical protein
MCTSFIYYLYKLQFVQRRACGTHDYECQIIKNSTESYVILRKTLRSLCYIDAHILVIASKYYVIHCLPIAHQYIRNLACTNTVITTDASLTIFVTQIKYLQKLTKLEKLYQMFKLSEEHGEKYG